MKKLSKVLGYVLNILILFIIIIMAFAIYYFVQVKVLNKAYANIFGYTFFEVATGSMSPTINAGDVIIVKLTDDVKKDDIIVCKDNNSFVTHRLISIQDNKILNECSKILYNTDNWSILAIVLSIPLTVILICILVLFGQRPDEAIKAFLETSDWTLSTKISPPPIEYDGHYLCTVSLRGHKNLVKPIRMGIRRGKKIVVNRQLCVANAFEDLIQERTPKFHHFVRYIYDKYGYPLSKHINTAIQADVTYIIMKPLEWVFLIFLYLFDEKPENRIATQYIGKTII